ncbi:MAG: permease-like cell division protein FtsX [Bacteroidota bacterium]
MKSRTRSTFYTSLFVIALVLFFLSLFAGGALYSSILLEDAQENFELMVTLPDYSKKEKREELGTWLEAKPYVKEIRYISKEEAGKRFIEELGDEFLEIMDGVNPLPASYNFKLNIDWVNSDSLAKINKEIEQQTILKIQDITYPIGEIEQLRENIGSFVQIAIIIGVIVTLIAFFIVNSTIRLAIYGKRLMIRSMQLIGATSRFIKAPFVRLGLIQGLLGAIIANAILVGLVIVMGMFDSGIGAENSGAITIKDMLFRTEFMILLGGIIIFGTILGWLSSSWAVNRFLNKNLDQLM